MTPITHAIILAAGRGTRLWPHTKDRPKCLLPIGGKTLIEHQVGTLETQGITDITVVTGYFGEKIRQVLGARVSYVDNARFVDTSSMYSLWLARSAATEGCIILNADVLFHAEILRSLLASPHADALAVDYDSVLVDEETKVQIDGERVLALSKTLQLGDAENVGMVKMSAAGSSVLFAKIAELLRHNHAQEMVPFAVNAIASSHFLAAVSVESLPWIEIDFPEDYQRACEEVYPAMCASGHALVSSVNVPPTRTD